MEITIQELLGGQATLIKQKEYLSAREYAEPFIDKMSKFTEDFRIQVKLADQLSVKDDKHIVYNRVWIQAVLPEEQCIENHDEVISLLYGLDIRKPVAKLYRGYLNRACTNLCVFNPQWLELQEMQPEQALDYTSIIDLMQQANDFKKRIEYMKTNFIPNDSIKDNLGKWVDFSLTQTHHNGVHATKLSPTMCVDAYKSVYLDPKSDYFVDSNVEESSLFNVYNAFTQVITDDSRDIMNKFEKTLLINNLLGVG